MADPTVKLTFTGNSEDAEKAIARLEQRYLALQNKISQAGKKGKEAAQDGFGMAGKWTQSLAGTVAGYLGITGAISSTISALQQLRQEEDRAALSQEELNKKLRIQGHLTEAQTVEAEKRIAPIADRTATPTEKAFAVSQQLLSSGFPLADSTGGALETMLESLQAGNLGDADPVALTQAAGQWLAATKQEKNAANLRKAMVGVQRLFEGTDLQVSDLGQLAGKSAGLSNLMSPEEILAGFDVIREAKGADTASTALKIFGERLSGAGGDKIREAELKKLGLKASDVDFVGEDIGTVLERLDKGYQSLPEAQRAGSRQRLFGTEGAEGAELLIAGRNKLPGLLDKLDDEEGFNEAVAVGTSGLGAAEIRRKNIRERQLARGADDTTNTLDSAATLGYEMAGDNKWEHLQVGYRRLVAGMEVTLGGSAEGAAGRIVGGTGLTSDEAKEYAATMKETAKTFQKGADKIADKIDKLRPGNPNAGRE